VALGCTVALQRCIVAPVWRSHAWTVILLILTCNRSRRSVARPIAATIAPC